MKKNLFAVFCFLFKESLGTSGANMPGSFAGYGNAATFQSLFRNQLTDIFQSNTVRYPFHTVPCYNRQEIRIAQVVTVGDIATEQTTG